MPMKFRISSKYGVLEEVRDGRVHTGIDFSMPEGTELRSIADGDVSKVIDQGNEGIGKGILIETNQGDTLIYGHLNTIKVKVGERIKEGELIAESGNTGHSTGPHLHFGLKSNGEFQDPTPLVPKIQEMSGSVEYDSFIEALKDGSVGIKEYVKDIVQETISELFFELCHFLYDISFTVCLVGAGISILVGVMGFDKGYRYAWLIGLFYTLTRALGGAYFK